MKKQLLTLLTGLFVLLQTFAAPIDSTKAVTMVSYEQGWMDSDGTLALKNNISEEIRNVTFLITYLDMSGKELDYAEFFDEVSIEPGMTKKIDIPAYEHRRNYHYYKSENSPTGSPAFKINFQLKEYNSEVSKSENDDDAISSLSPYSEFDEDGFSQTTAIILVAVIALTLIGVTIGLYVLVAVLAKKRNRNVILWVLLSVLISPLIAVIILLVIGKDDRINDDFR